MTWKQIAGLARCIFSVMICAVRGECSASLPRIIEFTSMSAVLVVTRGEVGRGERG
jgi:hypothetical protein